MRVERMLLVFGAFMFGAAVMAQAMRPTRLLGEGAPGVDLATLVPPSFGRWRIDRSRVPVALPTELDAQQKEIYDQMLVHTYVDDQGASVMLTIAYGGNQSRHLQVHRPEVCYAALGFQLQHLRKTKIATTPPSGPIPAMQMVATRGVRNEPVTYWIRIGDQVARGNLELGLLRLSYGIRGYIADGLLFRVSTITDRNEEGFEVQRRFIQDLLAALPVQARPLLVGRLALADH